MGLYINTGNTRFRSARNGEYVDKSGLIGVVNRTLFTEQRFSCVSRCRRFGKSMAAKMLAAYYDKSCDSKSLFLDLSISADTTFEAHLNKYPVIYLDMTGFVARYKDESLVSSVDMALKEDVLEAYPGVEVKAEDDLPRALSRIAAATGDAFFFIIDEWDAVCREFPAGSPVMASYLDWLRRMFKDSAAADIFAGVYMTGILPIKKYDTQSALNNFIEYSVVRPVDMSAYFGFTRQEVASLAGKYGMDYDELEKWYDGYKIGTEASMFNPNSVIQAVRSHVCESYWGQTAAYDAIVPYITMNFDGLKDDIIRMLAGGRCAVNPAGFQNDLSIINSRDDVLTVLIHLGYLSYDRASGECFIPNKEVGDEMELAVKAAKWQYLTQTLEQSRKHLQDTLAGNEAAVAAGIDLAHDENTSILSYNDETSLACVVSIAYIYAKNDYIIHREHASGQGFADMIFIPRKNAQSPALIVELKFNKGADTAIDQIKRKNYPAIVSGYAGEMLLVGIDYDKETKVHSCRIERFEK